MTAIIIPNHAVETDYRHRTELSRKLMERAAAVMPGGNTRTTTFHPPYPVVFEHAEGPWLWDADGHRYADLFFNGLSLIHGHAYRPISEAMAPVLDSGMAWSGASLPQIDFAEMLVSRIPTAEQVRFANSGSEAGMVAVKIARRVRGRELILKFSHAYHGSYPDLEAGLYGEGELQGRAVLAEFNDLASVERAMHRHGEHLAAVIYEPVMFTGRVVAPAQGFLRGVEALAKRHHVLTILDDCLMFRLAVGGSSERYGLAPDIVVLGKFLGGGTPLGAVLTSRDIMRVLDPTRKGAMFHGGSFNGNVLGCTAGFAAIRELTGRRIGEMAVRTERLKTSLRDQAAAAGIGVNVTGEGSVGGIAFALDPSRHEDDPSALTLSALFHLACLNHGVALGPGGLFSLATVIDDSVLEHIIQGMGAALRDVAS
jgi:glutamate-1-semialdehyde 2,1-aminomutase